MGSANGIAYTRRLCRRKAGRESKGQSCACLLSSPAGVEAPGCSSTGRAPGGLVYSADNTTEIIPPSCQPSPFANINNALLKAPVMAWTSECVGSINPRRLPTDRSSTGGLLASPDSQGDGGTVTESQSRLGADLGHPLLLTACCGLTTIKLVASR